jgi:hypothetical protein
MKNYTRRLIIPVVILSFLSFLRIEVAERALEESSAESFKKLIGSLETPAAVAEYSSTLHVVHPVKKNETERVSSVERSNNATKDEIEVKVDVPKKDWFQKKRFARSAVRESCKVYEHVCHSSGRWWYKQTEGAEQPHFTLLTNLRGAPDVYPAKVRVHHSDVDARMRNQTCHESPIPNHISLHGSFDMMLGEFYSRVLMGLNEIARTQVDNFDDFREQTQLYLHMYNKNGGSMLDSHHAFTDAFRGHPLLDFKSLLDNAGCQCLPRLLLCGYKNNKSGEHGNGTVIEPSGLIHSARSTYQGLRQMIRQRVIVDNPLAQDDIKAYKEKLLRSKGVEAGFDDWKLIGLAQRSGRRRWRNLRENENACDQALRRHKILCTEINVEVKESYPYSQAITHGALDGLFGIHGAQLTEAIWMKPGSLVVEYLVWLKNGVDLGDWTRTVQGPTPLGAIYSNTDLNHIGYPLQRHSAPYCYGDFKSEKASHECWWGRQSWANRDFTATSESIIDSVYMFFVNKTDSCETYQDWAADDFVLYNIQCHEVGHIGYKQPHHYYWKRRLETLPKYFNYSNDANLSWVASTAAGSPA